MSTTQQILTAIASQLAANLTGVETSDYLRDNFNAPIAIPWPKEVRYHGAMDGGDVEHDIVVAVIINRQSERAAATQIAQFLSYGDTNSIRAALEQDQTLGGVVDDLVCTDGRVASIITVNAAEYIRLDFNVTVFP